MGITFIKSTFISERGEGNRQGAKIKASTKVFVPQIGKWELATGEFQRLNGSF